MMIGSFCIDTNLDAERMAAAVTASKIGNAVPRNMVRRRSNVIGPSGSRAVV